MKKIGLVGGTGPESTLMYYKELNSQIDKITDGKCMPELSIESVNFRRAWEYVSNGKNKELAEYLAGKVKALVAAGAEVISLSAATMHMVIDEIEASTNVTLVSIPCAVCDEAQRRGYKKVALLGTIFTMEQDYMKKDFIKAGIDIVIPNETDRTLIAKRIFEELEFGIVKESTLKEFNEIISKMREEQQVEAVILGCTELPLLLNDDNCVLPCLDSVQIHIQKLIDLALD